MANVKIRRKTGSSSYDVVYPTADWSNIDNKPTTFTPTSHTHSGADITTGTVGTARLGTGTADSSTFLRGDGTWALPGGGERKSYSSLSGTSGAWYDLFTVSDGATGALFVSIQTYAHDDLLFTVGTGYGPSAVNTITVLNCVYNPSGSYASITGVRVTDTGLVQVQLTWSSGPSVDIDVAIYGSGTLPTLSASLTANANSYTIGDTVSITGLQGKIRSENGFVQGTTPIPAGTGTTNELTYWSGSNTVGTLSTGTYPSLTELSYVKGVSSALQTQLNNKAATSHTHSIGYYNSAITSNLDTLFSTGEFGFANTTTGRPEDYGQGINIVNSGTAYNSTDNWITQLAFGTAGSTSYFRTRVNTGAWTAWRKIWNDANDGSGSGLDADLLDGQQGSYFLDTSGSSQTKSGSLTVSGTVTGGTISSRNYSLNANGVPTSNLGTPTVAEMALFQEQFDNKTAFANIARISAQTSTDGTTWTEYTLTDSQKRGLVGGDAGTNITISYNTPYFRIKLLPGDYVYANALYGYFTTTYHTTAVQIYKKHDSGSYTQHTNSTAQVSGWPGHFYLPFSTIPWLDGGTLGTHWDEIYIVFIPTWNGSYPASNITLHKLQIWGGYPSSKRNVFSTDEFAGITFPQTIYIPEYLVHTSDSDTNLRFENDKLTINVGNEAMITLTEDDTQDIVKLGDGGDIDVNLNDDVFVEGSSGNVGIGTASPSHRLHVAGSNGILTTIAGASSSIQIGADGNGGVIRPQTVDRLNFTQANGTNVMTINAANVGIGTASPAVKLHVVGGTRITGQLNVMGDAETKRVWVDFEDGNDMGTIQVVQDGVAYKNLALQPDGNNVGIGTRSPSEKLEVNGVAKATSFTSTVATGTAPISVTSTTVATNLNADMLDGQHGSAYQLVSGMGSYSLSNHTHGNISNGGGWQSSPATIANGDSLVITQSGLLRNTNLSFNTNTDAFLAQNGTWVKPIYTSYKSTQQTNDTTTAATYHSITLPHSGYYSLTIYGMWSKTSTTNLVGNVISIITDNNTGTPKFDGAFEWQQSVTASAFVTENNSINIPTSGTSLGFTTQTATASRTETYWSMKGFLYTGTTTDKTLSFQFACSTAPGTGSVALEKIAIVATKVG